MTASTRWRAGLVGVAIAAALLGGALLARMGPALSLALTLALPGAESWLAPLHAEVLVEEMSIEAGGRRLVADLYRPSAPRGALLLVHGLSPAGLAIPISCVSPGSSPSATGWCSCHSSRGWRPSGSAGARSPRCGLRCAGLPGRARRSRLRA